MPDRVEYTAYTLDPGELSAGLFKVQFGPLRELMVGTYIPTWILFPWLGAPIPTAFLKLRDPFFGPVAFSLRATLAYLSAASLKSSWIDADVNRGGMLVVPMDAALSVRASDRFAQSVEVTYAFSTVGAEAGSTTRFEGSAVSSGLTLSTFSEWRLSANVALTLLNRILLHQDPTRVTGTARQGSTTVDVDLGLQRRRSFVACAVPGVEFTFGPLNLDLGLGYGSWWLPIVQFPLTTYGLVPEGNLYMRF